MPRLPKNKGMLYVYINEDVLEKLRELAREKHEKLRGALSLEVEAALTHWLIENGRWPVESDGSPPPRYLKVWFKVKNYLACRFGYDIPMGGYVRGEHLKIAIGAVRGDDPRTIQRWMETFVRHGVLRDAGNGFYEVLVK